MSRLESAPQENQEHNQTEQLSENDRFLPLAPDFVIEIRSQSDALETLPAKMREYVENGAQLDGMSELLNAGMMLDLDHLL
ncbi:Uma2 family endonuclease [Egbenema bharatensis]|uniref:Uma2 family endonuclease n=1 Tax=Egbenema bharatensis TaxID=3463334 RepID=UPI003A8762D8